MLYEDKRTGSRISVDESNHNLVAYMARSDAYQPVADADFKESEHPRDQDGKFTSGNGSSAEPASESSPEPEKTQDHTDKYTLSSAKEINDSLKERFNISFENGTNRGSKTTERNQYLNSKQYNVDSKATAAVKVKQLAGHVHHVLEDMESRGFNVKEAFSKGDVAFSAAAPASKYASGSSWQADGKGIVALSPRLLDEKYLAQMEDDEIQNRIESGMYWSVSGRYPDDYVRSTIAHEMAHALGDNQDPPAKYEMLDILHKLHENGTIGHYEQFKDNEDDVFDDLMGWIGDSLSEYATESVSEGHAELCAMVTSPHYVEGTLPKELEDHVYKLFGKK